MSPASRTYSFALAGLLALAACSGSRKSEAAQPLSSTAAATASTQRAPAKPEASTPGAADPLANAAPTRNLPDSQAELEALLATASPQDETAIKGKLRKLGGKASLDLSRPAVVGASLSAGFGGIALSEALDKGIRSEHHITHLASTMFFKSPFQNGRTQIDEALAADATVVFALDLLFWYAYTPGDLDARMASLEVGLRNLERVDRVLVLGDLPDMHKGQPWMLDPSSVPPPDQLESLNARIHDWARQRLHVHLVPLAEWSMALATDEAVVVSPGEKPVLASSLMNPDGLHPNAEGVRYMLKRLDPNLQLGFPDTAPDALEF